MTSGISFSFDGALPALRLIKEKDIPLVICSSKTKSEIEYYRRKLDNHHPFISENGGGIFIPGGYFDIAAYGTRLNITIEKGYHVIRLGAKYSELRQALKELQAEGYRIKGFGDMAPEEIAEMTNMTVAEAEMAKERDFDEPFIVTDTELRMHELLDAIEAKGFHWTQGNFLHLLGNNDKGKGVSLLIDFYKKKSGDVLTVAAGDSPNDIPMLERADHAIIVQKSDGNYDSRITLPRVNRADGEGPEGWNRAIMELIKNVHM
jgi:mannosyl-3-phosphoglycerate phosphatase family protein